MGRSNVRVIVRARPTASYAGDNFVFNDDTNSIDMRLPKDSTAGIVNNQQESWHFKVDRVLSNASQEQVFECCASEVVRSVMDGYNGTVMAYGQTGAGKTHTMTGGHVGFADRGIVPRAISTIYTEAAARPENNITIRLSYAEIYNELMFDLLTDVGVAEQSGDLAIVEDARGHIVVRGLSTPVAGTEEEALHLFFEGDTNRHVAEHALNKGSTRSHVIFTIYVESRSRVESSEKVIFSKLHLVDLAGSERVKKTGTDGVMLREATYINKSLTFLEQVVVALGSKHRDHVPYRQSKLTHMLKDSLGGNCKTAMVANIWPEAKMIEETTSTLRFATRMMRVSNEATVNVHLDPQLLLRKYERQIKDLKQELAMYDTLAGRSRVQREEYTPDEQRELEAKVQQYIDGEVETLEVASLRMVHETFACFKRLLQQARQAAPARGPEPAPVPAPDAGGPGAEAYGGLGAGGEAEEAGGGVGAGAGGGVGEYEEERGVSVPGRGEGSFAPAASRPPREEGLGAPGGGGGEDGEGHGDRHHGAGGLGGEAAARTASHDRPPDRQAAFADWKAREGQNFERAFEKNRSELKERRGEMREAMATANARKREIDEAKECLARKQADKPPEGVRDEELIDEEEYKLIKNLKDSKQHYREAFEKHRCLKMDVLQLEHLMQQCKAKLVQAFEEWFDQRYGHLARGEPPGGQAADDRYDPQEMFDLMEADRLETQHPDALAYHKARKTAARDVRHKRGQSLGAATGRIR